MKLKPLYDFSFSLPDRSRVTLCGVGTLYQIRAMIKNLKQDSETRKQAQALTRRHFEVTPHAFCPDCQPCKNCHKTAHECECVQRA